MKFRTGQDRVLRCVKTKHKNKDGGPIFASMEITWGDLGLISQPSIQFILVWGYAPMDMIPEKKYDVSPEYIEQDMQFEP